MSIRKLLVAGYRSIRRLELPLGRINVLTGPNGCGKSNLYNAVFLLSKAARGGLGSAIAAEGGMPSVLYAGPEGPRLSSKKPPRRVALSIGTDIFDYDLQIGLPQSATPSAVSLFRLDPEVKQESIRATFDGARPVTLLERDGTSTTVRDAEGRMVRYPLALDKTESVLAQIAEPHQYPEISRLHMEMRRWRFYHAFRTDPDSPLRRPRVGVFTPVLDHDGSDLAAALQTIVEVGDAESLEEAIGAAFSGGTLRIIAENTRFRVQMQMPGVARPLEATELSDGTLRFLCLCAALLSPRPPSVLALNEPETSLHPDLIPPLASLMSRAARDSQLWITTHSRALASAIEEQTGEPALRLALNEGQTVLERPARL